MVKQSSKESNLPGFHAHNSLTGSYKTDSLFAKYHEDLSAYLIPAPVDPIWQDCYTPCIEDCPQAGQARKICVASCTKECPCKSPTPCRNGFMTYGQRDPRTNSCFLEAEPC